MNEHNAVKPAVIQTVVLCTSTSYVAWFPIYRAGAVYEHRIVFSAHTQNGQLADRKEMFAGFDNKCIGLELQATPFKVK